MVRPRFKPRHQYDLDSEEAAGEAAATGTPDNLERDAAYTQQHHTPEVDINVMMRRMGVTDGALPPAIFTGELHDYTELPTDLTEAFAIVRHAENRFGQLPADLRARFNNNAAELMAFIHDPKNADEAVKLGLLQQEKPPAPPAPEPPTTQT